MWELTVCRREPERRTDGRGRMDADGRGRTIYGQSTDNLQTIYGRIYRQSTDNLRAEYIVMWQLTVWRTETEGQTGAESPSTI